MHCGSAPHGWPPLPSSPASQRSKISVVGKEGRDLHSTLALQYFPSIFTVSTVSFTNNPKPDFDGGLRLVLAPAIKAQWDMENTGVHQTSQSHQNQEKLQFNLEKPQPTLFLLSCMLSNCSKLHGRLARQRCSSPGARAAPMLPTPQELPSPGCRAAAALPGWLSAVEGVSHRVGDSSSPHASQRPKTGCHESNSGK